MGTVETIARLVTDIYEEYDAYEMMDNDVTSYEVYCATAELLENEPETIAHYLVERWDDGVDDVRIRLAMMLLTTLM